MDTESIEYSPGNRAMQAQRKEIKSRGIGISSPTKFVRSLPMIVGPGIAAGSILSVHATGLAIHFESYATAPPTISRALLDPAIAGPFAIAMIASAFFLLIAISQVALLLGNCMKLSGQTAVSHITLLLVVLFCELVAVAGMIVLSQFTGNISSRLHDIGSYMLFFGHAIGITIAGLVIRSILAGLEAIESKTDLHKRLWSALRKFPRRSAWVAGLSVLYGIVYFGGKFLSDDYFFWQRTIMSVLEFIVILSFLGYLSAFRPLLEIKAAHKELQAFPKNLR